MVHPDRKLRVRLYRLKLNKAHDNTIGGGPMQSRRESSISPKGKIHSDNLPTGQTGYLQTSKKLRSGQKGTH